MCRLLFVESAELFDPVSHLAPFAQIAKNSKEYQGHGWGCSWIENKSWRTYKNIRPVWEDGFQSIPRTARLLAHARSAFRDEGIAIENNMPFGDGKTIFIFNGELHGVRIKEEGRIGAEKVFHLIKRLDRGDKLAALKMAAAVIQKRSRYIRAMNIILADESHAFAASVFNEDPDYFTLHSTTKNGARIVSSEPYPGESGWGKIQNGFIGVI